MSEYPGFEFKISLFGPVHLLSFILLHYSQKFNHYFRSFPIHPDLTGYY